MTIVPNALVREIYETKKVRDAQEREIPVWALRLRTPVDFSKEKKFWEPHYWRVG
jgi:hypothetical protein